MKNRSETLTIRLTDYHSWRRQFLIDPASGVFSTIVVDPSDNVETNWAGFGATVGFGLWRRERILVALYGAGDDKLVLQLGAARFSLWEDGVSARKRSIGPLIRRFEVLRRESPIWSRVFWRQRFEDADWPVDGDIFSLVARSASTPEAARLTAKAWRAVREGHKTVGLISELDRELQKGR